MKPATVHEIKQELLTLPASALAELCLRLAKFKKDNKELLTYLLFEATDPQAYVENVKKEIDLGFEELPKPNLYLYQKKSMKDTPHDFQRDPLYRLATGGGRIADLFLLQDQIIGHTHP